MPAGRVFLHTASHVGQIIPLPHVRGGDPDLPVQLEVLSVRPAVFDVHNFFTRAESRDLVDRALAETKESHRMKRSSTGATGYTVNNRRTSENGFDTDGKTSMAVKRCVCVCFQMFPLFIDKVICPIQTTYTLCFSLSSQTVL